MRCEWRLRLAPSIRAFSTFDHVFRENVNNVNGMKEMRSPGIKDMKRVSQAGDWGEGEADYDVVI